MMDLECPMCGSEDVEWIRGYSQTETSPAEEPGYECRECGHVATETPEERRIAAAEFNEDSWREDW